MYHNVQYRYYYPDSVVNSPHLTNIDLTELVLAEVGIPHVETTAWTALKKTKQTETCESVDRLGMEGKTDERSPNDLSHTYIVPPLEML